MTDAAPPTGPDALYHHHLSEGRLMIQRCNACSRQVFAPRVLCKFCGSDRLDWVEPSGRATVYSLTVVRRKPERGGDYLYGLFELEEGARMISTVIGADPESVAIGDPVVAEIETTEAGPRLVFRKAQGAA